MKSLISILASLWENPGRSNQPPRERGKYSVVDDVAQASRYVWVLDDGSARELSPKERAYLATRFDPTDGDRPYVKERYRQKTPDGRLIGYLARWKLPLFATVRPYDPKLDAW